MYLATQPNPAGAASPAPTDDGGVEAVIFPDAGGTGSGWVLPETSDWASAIE